MGVVNSSETAGDKVNCAMSLSASYEIVRLCRMTSNAREKRINLSIEGKRREELGKKA